MCQSKLGGIWSEDFPVQKRGHCSYLGWNRPTLARHHCSEASLWDRRTLARPQIIIRAGKASSSYIPNHSNTYTQASRINSAAAQHANSQLLVFKEVRVEIQREPLHSVPLSGRSLEYFSHNKLKYNHSTKSQSRLI